MTHFSLIDTTLERKIADAEPVEPPLSVLVAEPLKGPWTGNNNLGYRTAFAPDSNNRQTILKLPEWGFPVVWTISLGIVGFPRGVFDGFGIKAILEPGVGGVTQTYEIDWRNGAQISLVMNALNVIAEFSNLDVAETEGLELTVAISRGNRPGNGMPVSTLRAFGPSGAFPGSPYPAGTLMEDVVIPVGPPGTGLLLIPEFATRIIAVPTGTSANIANFFNPNNVLSLVSGNSGALSVVSSLRGSDLQNRFGIDVTGSARFATFFNDSGTDVTATFYAEIAG